MRIGVLAVLNRAATVRHHGSDRGGSYVFDAGCVCRGSVVSTNW